MISRRLKALARRAMPPRCLLLDTALAPSSDHVRYGDFNWMIDAVSSGRPSARRLPPLKARRRPMRHSTSVRRSSSSGGFTTYLRWGIAVSAIA
jgi:hypothetical protein